MQDYSIFVYSEQKPETDLIRRLMEQGGSVMEVAEDGKTLRAMADSLVCFEVKLPSQLDPVVLPYAFRAAQGVEPWKVEPWLAEPWMVEPWVVEVVVDSDDEDWGEAFAQALADAVSGAAVEAGTQVWPVVTDPEQGAWWESPAVRVLELTWYGRWRPGDVPLPTLFVDQAERWLPEAVPRRHGFDYAFQTKYADGGVDAMVRAWQSPESSRLDFACAKLPWEGDMTTTTGIAQVRGMWRLALRCLRDDFVAIEPRRRLRALFTGVAEGGSAEYATAEVKGGPLLVDTGFGYKLDGEGSITPWRGDSWDVRGLLGLTPCPTWWSWFGPSYLPLVQKRLDHAPSGWRVTPTGRGTLLELADLPSGHKELRGPVGRRLGLGWMPSNLLVRGRYGSEPARVLPDWRSGG